MNPAVCRSVAYVFMVPSVPYLQTAHICPSVCLLFQILSSILDTKCSLVKLYEHHA
jgi:hypothetical protein